jgi:DNA recombination protein Rad52
MSFTPEQIAHLQAPLDQRHVKPPPQGKYGSYVDGHHVLSEANRIFGFDGWGYEITMLTLCSRVECNDSRGNPQVRVGYRCTVKATVGGVTREGAAVGTGMAKPENEADAHESALKEAETDALKRALRSFGNTFGLALYDKGDDPAIAQAPLPVISEEQRIELMTLFEASGAAPGPILKRASENAGHEVKDLRELPLSEYEPLKNFLTSKATKEPSNA